MTNSPAVNPLRRVATRLTGVLALVLAGVWPPGELADAQDRSELSLGQPMAVVVIGAGHDIADVGSAQLIDITLVERRAPGRGVRRIPPSSWHPAGGWPALARIGGRLRGRHA